MMRLPLMACLLLVAATAGADEISLSGESRKSLAIAIYNNGYGLVWDERVASLGSGRNRVAFEGISRQMLLSSTIQGAQDSTARKTGPEQSGCRNRCREARV